MSGCDSAGTDERSYPASEVRGGDKRSYPASEIRGGGREEQPHPRPGTVAGRSYPTSEARGSDREELPRVRGHIQGAVAAWAQEGLEELFHLQRQKGCW